MLEIEGLNRKISAIVAHLTQACAMLEVADARIAGQKSRISALEDLTTTDDLTGIKNRRGFQELFQREIENCGRGLSKGGLLIMIDLDNFKSVNDTFGHPAGDSALKLVARTLIGEIRKTDVAARLGGDEFILLLVNTTRENAAAKAQSIASHLNNLSLAWYGDIIRLQASVGIKNFGAGDKADAILQAADSTMYARKSARKSGQKS
jgi:diguanylate cyclase (GGDEF)-like protein